MKPARLITLAAIPCLLAATVSDTHKPPFPSQVSITVEGDTRIIRANGIPNHDTGPFPGPGNPNTIAPQKYEYRVPAHPKPAASTTRLRMQPFGIALNGVVFDPGANEWWNNDRSSGWQYEPMAMPPNRNLGVDHSHAHVQPNGAYHYHAEPTALLEQLTGGKEKMVLVGWAADGFPIYNDIGFADPKNPAAPPKHLKSSYAVKKGTRPGGPGGAYDGTFVNDFEYVAGSGDLDECNGMTGPTPEAPEGMYHYVLTDDFPYIPRLFKGTPDPSFNRGPGGPGGRGPRNAPPGGPPPRP